MRTHSGDLREFSGYVWLLASLVCLWTMSSAEPVMKSTEGLGVCSRRDSAHASASLDGGVSDIHVTCVHQSLHSSSVDVLSQEMMCHLSGCVFFTTVFF